MEVGLRVVVILMVSERMSSYLSWANIAVDCLFLLLMMLQIWDYDLVASSFSRLSYGFV